MKRLNGYDAMLLYSETPAVHTHTMKIAVVDIGPSGLSFVRFRQLIEERLPLLEPLRYRLIDIPWKLHHPMWLENCAVDLDYHLRRVQLSGDGGRRRLDEVIAQIASTPLDRSRPLWEFHFVEGLDGNRIAVVGKVHHSLADGVASANLMARAMDLRPGQAQPEVTADRIPKSRELITAAARDYVITIRQVPGVLGCTCRGVAKVARRSRQRIRHPAIASKLSAPDTFINHVISPRRAFASATLSLDDVKEVGKALGITINTLVLAVAAGALRELLLRYDGHADVPIIASVPSSLNASADRLAGNELGGMLVALPVQVEDTLERTRLTGHAVDDAKENYRLLGPELSARWMEFLPPALAPAAFARMARRKSKFRLFNVPISNVPGPRRMGRFGDLTVRELYSVGPLTAGCGLNITVWSYVDQLNISVLADDQTVPDPHEVTDALVRSFSAIRAADRTDRTSKKPTGVSGPMTPG